MADARGVCVCPAAVLLSMVGQLDEKRLLQVAALSLKALVVEDTGHRADGRRPQRKRERSDSRLARGKTRTRADGTVVGRVSVKIHIPNAAIRLDLSTCPCYDASVGNRPA
jgi:hypothetical protein